MRRLVSVLLCFISLNLFTFTSISTTHAEARQCAMVKIEAKKIFEAKYKSSEGALNEIAKRTVKAYLLIIQNKDCIPAKDYKEMINTITELKKSCDDAKKDKFVWGMMKSMCSAYTPLWKYVK